MKVISISMDRKLFEGGSAILERQKEYATKMAELHIVVFSLRKNDYKYSSFGNLHIYPTNSSSKLFYISDALKIGKKIIENTGNVVVSTQDPFETGLVGYLLKRKFRLPLQIQIHTDFLSSYFKNSFLNRIRVSLAKFLIPKAGALRVVSPIISDSVKRKFPNLKARTDILPIFIDVEKILDRMEKFYEQPKVSKGIFIVSRFTKEKRIDLGIEVFKRVFERHKDAELIIVGSGPERDNLIRKIGTCGISTNARIEEWNKNVPNLLYQRAEIFLLTSEYEGYGMTLIEAGVAGCPIVTTKVGIAKTDLFKNGENSFVCPVGDVDCLANAIIDLIEDPKKRNLFKDRMQDNIRDIAISKEQYVARYIALLEALLEKK